MDCFRFVANSFFAAEGKVTHSPLGKNSNFSLMLLGWEEKRISRHHVPKYWKCHVDLKYMVCICKCRHVDGASHLNTTKTEQLMPPRTAIWRENVIWHKVLKSEKTEELREFSFPYLLALMIYTVSKVSMPDQHINREWGFGVTRCIST